VQETLPSSPRKRKRRLVGWGLAIGVAVFAAIGFGVYRHLTNPDRIRAKAEAYLQQFVLGEVHIRAAEFDWNEGITLHDVAVLEATTAESPPPPGDTETNGAHLTRPLFACPEVALRPNRAALWRGRLQIDAIEAQEPELSIIRDVARKRTNLTGVVRAGVLSKASVQAEGLNLPLVELRQARVRVLRQSESRTDLVEDLRLTVRAKPRTPTTPVYDIIWDEAGPRPADGHSEVDLRTGTVRNIDGGLPWMSIEAVLTVVDARFDGAGSWCELLGLDGIVRARDYDFGDGPDANRRAAIELDGVAISIPVADEEHGLTASERYLHFESVRGTIVVTKGGINADFRGTLHGSPCEVRAYLHGGLDTIRTLDDVNFEAYLSIRQLTLPRPDPDAPPAQQRFCAQWDALRVFYEDYDPAGLIDLDIWVDKLAGADAPFELKRIILTAHDVSAELSYFPYRLTNTHGVLDLSSAGLILSNLVGNHNGGEVHVDGWFGSTSVRSASELWISGERIPTDRALYDALPEEYQRLWDRFAPAGRIGVDLVLRRNAAAPDEPLPEFDTEVQVAFDALDATYDGFPYPLRGLRGRFTVRDDWLTVHDVETESNSGTHLHGAGRVHLAESGVRDLDLRVSAQALPIDARLLHALPPEHAEKVRTLRASGTCDVDVQLSFADRPEDLETSVQVRLRDVQCKPASFPLTLAFSKGIVRLDETGLSFSELAGLCHGAVFRAEGQCLASSGGENSLEGGTKLRILAKGVTLDDALLDALPNDLTDELRKWQVEGGFDVAATLVTTGEEAAPLRVEQAVCTLRGATVRHPKLPEPLTDVRGRVLYEPARIELANLTAQWGATPILINLELPDSLAKDATLDVRLDHLTLDDGTSALLPERFREVWEHLSLAGEVDARLSLVRPAVEAQPDGAADMSNAPVWTIQAELLLNDVDIPRIARLQDVSGRLSLAGLMQDRSGGMRLDGKLDGATLRLYDRVLTDVRAGISYLCTSEGVGRLSVENIEGSLCGGRVAGRTEVRFADEGACYTVEAQGQGLLLKPFLNDPGQWGPPPQPLYEAGGSIDVSVFLTGGGSDIDRRRGGGVIEIRDADLYRLPIMLAILHVINLSIPDGQPFSTGNIDFYLLGNELQIERMQLRSEALALAGKGKLSMTDQHLDLQLVCVSPTTWERRIPVWTDLLEGAAARLAEVHVFGPLRQPNVEARTLPGITAELKHLFRAKPVPPPDQPRDRQPQQD
jgi:hypothetical protein